MKLILIILSLINLTASAQKFKAYAASSNFRSVGEVGDTLSISLTPTAITIGYQKYKILRDPIVSKGQTTYLCDNDVIIYYNIINSRKAITVSSAFNSDRIIYIEQEKIKLPTIKRQYVKRQRN